MTIRASDRGASEQFYLTVLSVLGIEPTHRRTEITAWEDFAVMAADGEHPPTRHLHVGFVASSRAEVDAFWRTAVDLAYGDDGAPGERRQYGEDYYAAFLRDPDGNSVEAVVHDGTRRGGCVDHLWIGVRDLPKSAHFYTTIARHTGLRTGTRWPGGAQFAGAWATFALIQDGRPPTENLHLAFPAPDRTTVQQFHEAARSAGYRDNGTPGERPHYGERYYAAYVRDPDGTNVESVCRS